MAKKVEKKARLTKTFTATTKAASGFTLIEILVVIGLAALITGVFVPSFVSAFREKGEAAVRKLALTVGEARDRAMLNDKLVRLVIDFDKQTLNFQEAPSEYLVKKEQDRPPSEREREELEKKEALTFTQSKDLMSEPMKLSSSLRVIQVRSPRYKKPATEGQAYVYFFNNGSTDGATVYFETDEKTHQAIVIHPVTGQSRLEPLSPEDK